MIAQQIADALEAAHEQGIIHRDLKPQNIMTGGFGEVLVLDWGLAVLTDPGEDVTASAGGTPSYMAPEMITPPYLLGPRSDVYLLGAILFRFLTGQVPNAGESASSSQKAVSRNEIITPEDWDLPSGFIEGVTDRAGYLARLRELVDRDSDSDKTFFTWNLIFRSVPQ